MDRSHFFGMARAAQDGESNTRCERKSGKIFHTMQILHTLNALTILYRDGKYYARYDAGAHQPAMREDEITEAEYRMAIERPENASRMLLRLQKRLVAAGVNPYISNVQSCS